MKKCLILLISLFILPTIQAQESNAKLKYQEAEKAFQEEKYQECLSLIDKTEKIMGKSTSTLLLLRIKTEQRIWEAKPFESYDQVDKLKNLCHEYLQKYDIDGLSEVYELSKKLPKVNSQAELTQLGKQYQKENKASQLEQAIKYHNLIFVEGGTYMMGFKKASHEVTVNDFYIGKYEVTVKEWNDYLEATGRTGANNIELNQFLAVWQKALNTQGTAKSLLSIVPGAELSKVLLSDSAEFMPKENNSAFYRKLPEGLAYKKKSNEYVNQFLYPEIINYCKWLSKQYGGTWRLPTEAEWEYAARNGNTAEHIGNIRSKELIQKYNTYYKDFIPVIELSRLKYVIEKTVGRKVPNALGIYDMIGNVCELCSDYYDPNYYKTAPKINPQGAISGEYRNSRDDVFRSAEAFRNRQVPRGFRIVYIPD